jgi:hypothetical protein
MDACACTVHVAGAVRAWISMQLGHAAVFACLLARAWRAGSLGCARAARVGAGHVSTLNCSARVRPVLLKVGLFLVLPSEYTNVIQISQYKSKEIVMLQDSICMATHFLKGPNKKATQMQDTTHFFDSPR